MTQEEKAKRYDEAIEKLCSLHDDYDTVSTLIDIKEELENIFPELKESEDERIRKGAITSIRRFIEYTEEEDCAPDIKDMLIKNAEKQIAWLEKQGEQKPADKVSLDFKKGDILYEQKTMSILLVYERNGSWLMTFCDYWMLKEKLHVEFPYENYGFVQEMSLVPATKEQRDLLFQNIKENGYEWDAELKQLRKIEQKPEEKPLISLKDFQDAFELKAKQYNIELPNRGYDIHAMCKELYSLLIQPKQKWSEEDERTYKSITYSFAYNYPLTVQQQEFVKSLKERVQPQNK